MNQATTKVDHKGLVRLLESADFLLANFAPFDLTDNNRRRSWQLTCGRRINVQPKRGANVAPFERMEWHVVTFGDLPSAPPAIYMHADYGEKVAIKRLLLAEIDESRKHGRIPTMFARPAFWGSCARRERPATFTIAAGGSVNRDLRGDVYHVEIGSASLSCAGFTFAPADSNGHIARWSKPSPDDGPRDPRFGHYYYTFEFAGTAVTSVSALS